MTSAATPVSAATKQEHDQNDNQDHFHENFPLAPAAYLPRTQAFNGVFKLLFPTRVQRANLLWIGPLRNWRMGEGGERGEQPGRNLSFRSELHPKATEEQTSRHPVYANENNKPPKPRADDRSHEPARHIEETARLASSVETVKDPGTVQRTKD
jgi:hypothetical protein